MVIARTIRIGPRRPAQLGCVHRSLEGLCSCMEANKKTQKKSVQTLCRLINPKISIDKNMNLGGSLEAGILFHISVRIQI